MISKEAMDCFDGINTTFYGNRNGSAKIMLPVIERQTDEVRGIMVVSFPASDIYRSGKLLNKNVQILQWGVLLLVVIFAFYMSRVLVKPFRKVTNFLEESSTGVEEEGISLPDYTETVSYTHLQKHFWNLDWPEEVCFQNCRTVLMRSSQEFPESIS